MVKRFFTRVHRLDANVFKTVARTDVPILDEALPRLSQAADRSKLWLAIAVALAAFGGPRGKRAALRSTFAIAIASAVTNVSVKIAVRRKRPDIDIVPIGRLLKRVPRSSSFPSGHSASAAAFATGLALEHPVAGAGAGVLAAGVGASRVYTGVHYPSDVLTGFAIGAGAALTTLRFWPRAPEEPEQPALTLVDVEMGGDGVGLAVNAGAGSTDDGLASKLRDQMPDAEIVEVPEGELLAATLRALATRSAVLGVAGGDGSINTAAAIAREQDHPLLIVPGGTLNHLARDLGITSLEDAIKALQGGRAARIDVSAIDGRPFLNTASCGPYPDLVDEREKREGVIGKWPALVVAILKVLRRTEPVPIEIDGRSRTIWMIFIGNCRYEPRGFLPSRRSRLDDGMLDVRLVAADRRFARARLIGALLTGRLGRSKVYEERSVRSMKIRSQDGPLRLSRDGETFDGGTEFMVEKLDSPLRVLVPPPDDQSRASTRPPTKSTPSKAAIPSPVTHGPAAL